MNSPVVTVIIPTHNRVAAIRRALDALSRQTIPLHILQVVVVADGCVDSTKEMISTYSAPFTLTFVEQSQSGPSVARNNGAQRAIGTHLIFMDDDIEPSPNFVSAHIEAHQNGPSDLVVIGYLPVRTYAGDPLFRASLLHWWETAFDKMKEPGRRFAYTDLLSGNFSVSADLFRAVGGFYEGLKCHEDYELGMRLIKLGAQFQFEPRAVGIHHEVTDLRRAISRKRDEGEADVRLAEMHPEITGSLRFVSGWPRSGVLALAGVTLTRALILEAVLFVCAVASRFKARSVWRALSDRAMSFAYWSGMVNSGVERARMAREKRSVPGPETVLIVDIKDGLEVAATNMDEHPSDAVIMRYGEVTLGKAVRGATEEKFRGKHLRYLLVERCPEKVADLYLRSQGASGVQLSTDLLVRTWR